jgi:hypothetical protein
MEVHILPPHGDLQHAMELRQADIGRHIEPTPNGRPHIAEGDFED